MTKERWSLITTNCADCGLGTLWSEWYKVRDEVWDQAWAGRLKPWHKLPGQQILCIGCLEQRLGHTLMSCDFTSEPVNNPSDPDMSDRLRDRLTTEPVKRKPGRSKIKPKAVLREQGVESQLESRPSTANARLPAASGPWRSIKRASPI